MRIRATDFYNPSSRANFPIREDEGICPRMLVVQAPGRGHLIVDGQPVPVEFDDLTLYPGDLVQVHCTKGKRSVLDSVHAVKHMLFPLH